MVIDEIVEVRALVRVDAAYRLPHRAVERAVGLGVDPIRCHLGTVMEGRDDNTAALLFRERDIGLGQRRRLNLAAHEQVEAVARAVRHAAKFDLVAGNETFQHLQGQIMRAEEERHPDLPVGKLLRGLNR